jgi:hypothetical protein
MRPDPPTTNAFLYCLAFAAEQTEVQVIFYLAMSNHYHAGVIDTHGRLPIFLECFHKLFAKHQNVLRGRWENFWAPEQTSVVQLVEGQDVLDKMVYTLTNPVNAHLVARAAEWPGATSLGAQLSGEEIEVSRPRHFFRGNGPMPDVARLSLVVAPGWESVPHDQFISSLRDRLASAEEAAAIQRDKAGIRILGAKAVLRQHWFQRPRTVAPRRRLRPRVACKNFWRRAETIGRNKAFVAAHQVAREQAVAGLEAVFPAGTYWFRRFAGVRCEPPEPVIAA